MAIVSRADLATTDNDSIQHSVSLDQIVDSMDESDKNMTDSYSDSNSIEEDEDFATIMMIAYQH